MSSHGCLYDVFLHPQARFSGLATFGEKQGLDELEQEFRATSSGKHGVL